MSADRTSEGVDLAPIVTRRISTQLLWLLTAACAIEPKPGVEQNQIQGQVARDVARICALPPAERQSEIERLKATEHIAIVCPQN